MDLSTLLLFVPACFALNLFPGPNNLVALANGQKQGFMVAWLAGLGRLLAFVVMIALAALGLVVILETSELVFLGLKLVGAGYLFWIALQMWRTPAAAAESLAETPNRGVLVLAQQEFLLAAGNPKAILIFTAFFPQFIDPGEGVGAQFAALGMVFLLLEWLVIAGYAACGYVLGNWLQQPRRRQWFNRGCASALAVAGVGLLASDRRG